jgi:hypothetical protein
MATPNTLFAIFAVSDASAIEARLRSVAAWPYLNVGSGEWLLIAPSSTTTKEVCDLLGMGPVEPSGSGIVVRAEGYYGRSAKSTWEWIATKLGAELGAASTV